MTVLGVNVNKLLQVDKFKDFTFDRVGNTAHTVRVSCLLWSPMPLLCRPSPLLVLLPLCVLTSSLHSLLIHTALLAAYRSESHLVTYFGHHCHTTAKDVLPFLSPVRLMEGRKKVFGTLLGSLAGPEN